MLMPTLPTTAQEIARDSWLIPTLAAEPGGAYVGVHSLVLTGREPVIVDTGCSLVRDEWAAQVFSVVDPADVRWVFISHDDHDHIGNLPFVLEQCPQATLVCSFSIVSRLAGDIELPLDRMRWVDQCGSFEAGGRTLHAVRPPMFDSPATRGLFDPATGLLWAADSFGTFFPGEVYDAEDIGPDLYDATFDLLNAWNTPWLEWVDADRYRAHVAATADLPLEVVASAHGPVHRGARIADAFARTLALGTRAVPPMPGQDVLDALLATVLAPA
jgi:flavorubredoxin